MRRRRREANRACTNGGGNEESNIRLSVAMVTRTAVCQSWMIVWIYLHELKWLLVSVAQCGIGEWMVMFCHFEVFCVFEKKDSHQLNGYQNSFVANCYISKYHLYSTSKISRTATLFLCELQGVDWTASSFYVPNFRLIAGHTNSRRGWFLTFCLCWNWLLEIWDVCLQYA